MEKRFTAAGLIAGTVCGIFGQTMAPLLRLLLGLLAVAGTFTLDADGIVVPQYGYARADIPDQRAPGLRFDFDGAPGFTNEVFR